MERIKTIDRRLRRVPDLLPVCLQDFLRRGKPEVREQQQVSSDPPLDAAFAGRHFFVFHGG